MIEAQLHRRIASSLLDSEDILTSTVFGYLRYIPPDTFWTTFLERGRCCNGTTLIHKCKKSGIKITDYRDIAIYFWPVHNKFGEPDLLIVFSGGSHLPICFIIEAKLWAAKSGRGRFDQLNRYLSASNDLPWLSKITNTKQPPLFLGLIYLTPKAAWDELRDSIKHAIDPIWTENMLYTIEWKDILEAANEAKYQAQEPYNNMLRNVDDFLNSLQINYFHGFNHLLRSDMVSILLPIHKSLSSCKFRGFTFQPLLKFTEYYMPFGSTK